jgi:YegS/Rv2252/BmrU family lipid kinase
MLMAAQLVPQSLYFPNRIFHWHLIYNLTSTVVVGGFRAGSGPPAIRAGQFSNGENLITAYRNTVLIYNPRAGRLGRGGRVLLTRAVEVLTKNGHTVTVVPTTGPKTAGAIVREHIGRGADLIVAAGGDGTINEVAEGMMHSGIPLAILPAGTANVLAMEMGIGSKMERAADRIEDAAAHCISVGQLTSGDGAVSRYFLLMAGAGLDAHVAYNVSAAVKARFGKLAYWIAGWRVLGRKLPLFSVEANGQTFRPSFALFSKVRNYGGDFAIAQEVSLFDDEFEMVLFEGRSSFLYVKYFAGLIFNRHRGMTGVTVMRTREALLTGPEDVQVYAQIDGEVAGRLPARVKIIPNALTLLIPPEYVKHVP